MNALHRLIHRIYRVPEEPAVPPGEAGSVRVFRASKAFYRYSLLRWALVQLGALAGVVGGLVFAYSMMRTLPDPVAPWIRTGELLAVLGFIAQLPVTFLMVRLDFQYRWYIVTDRSLRIREGITTVREQTLTFANIQNITVRQGPLQRLLGIQDLAVRTAGGGSGGAEKGKHAGPSMHEGFFRGVENAEEIRDVIREGVRRARDAGLGDPDDASTALPPVLPRPAGAVAAARELAAEAAALRAVLPLQRGRG